MVRARQRGSLPGAEAGKKGFNVASRYGRGREAGAR